MTTHAPKPTTRKPRASLSGFTLIELMITVAIIGILTAIAYPSYTEYVVRARRADATAVMAESAIIMERYHATNDTYADATVPAAVSPKGATDSGVFYNIAFVGVPDEDTFTLRASPAGAQASDSCGALEIDQAGRQTAAKTGCW